MRGRLTVHDYMHTKADSGAMVLRASGYACKILTPDRIGIRGFQSATPPSHRIAEALLPL